jgi:MFS superfamily sulfate permease-like transporter
MYQSPKLKDYLKHFPNDLTASLVVFLVALPLCLGIALASNAPLISGITAGVVGGIVVGLGSRSHLSVTGPAAGLTAIIFSALTVLPSFEFFLAAVVIAGIIQVILGFAKAGIIGDYVPNSVIKGMLAAIGLILLLNQFPHLLGDDSSFITDEGVKQKKGNLFSNFFYAFSNINSTALIIGVSCLALHFIWEKIQKKLKGIWMLIPGPLLMVIIGVLINSFIKSQSNLTPLSGEHLVVLPEANSFDEFISYIRNPDWSAFSNYNVISIGVTLAIVASIETLLSIEAVDKLDPYKRATPTNRELKAQGFGNIVSGLLGGLPVTSVIVRSSANVEAGAKTKTSAILHGILLLVFVAFLPFILNLIPKSALAAILVLTGYKLANPVLIYDFYKKGWNQFLPFIMTIIAILATDLLKGVLIGIAVGLAFIIRSNFKTAILIFNDGKNYLFRLRKDVSFLNKAILKQGLEKVPENSFVIIDLTKADFIDKDILDVIDEFQKHAGLQNIQVDVKNNSNKETIFTKP